MCGFAMYDLPNVDVVGYDVVSNRPKVAAYRAPGAPITSFAVESLMDELAIKLGIDPLTLREKKTSKHQDIAKQVSRAGSVNLRQVKSGAGLGELGIERPPVDAPPAPQVVEHHGHGGHH